jgi:ferredoxin
MALKVNTRFIQEIKKYGAFDISACFNCGNCTAVCPLSAEDSSFPRKLIRAGHLGLKDFIDSSIDPWLCYYCGECSSTCPRQAFPGEYMMTLRRYLISKYDMMGISKIFYKLGWLQPLLTLIVCAAAYKIFDSFTGDFSSLAGKIELAFPVFITVVIAGYVINMYRHVVIKPMGRLAVSMKPKHIFETFLHGFTQIRFIGCAEKDWFRYISHILVMSGYVMTLIISNLHVLEPLNRHYSWNSVESVLVWYASISILVGGLFMMGRRLLKSTQSAMFSHSSDWLFVGMLVLVGLSNFATQFVNITQGQNSHLLSTLYRMNLAIETSWILLIVPFTKWVHIFFRPLAIYFYNMKKDITEKEQGV